MTRDAAERLAAAISQIGLHAVALAESDVPQLAHAKNINHARCLSSGFEIVGLDGQRTLLIPWDQLDLLSVGLVPFETVRRDIAPEAAIIHSAPRTGPTTIDLSLSNSLEAWIACRTPDCAYRIDSKRMNYEYLGSRKTDSATANFRLFLDDLIARAPGLYLTPSTRAYAEHGSVHDYSFESSQDLMRATILHMLIRRAASAR
jgi:hypothetical protein